MQLAEVIGHVNLVGQIMKEVMREGEHFGTIPGCGSKKCLLLPGAQKLSMTFRFAPKYRVEEKLADNGHREYRVVCLLRTMGTKTFVGQGLGFCSTQESKYSRRPPADVCNTVLKMAKKRAFVDAVIVATSASDIFTQDLEEEAKPDHRAEALLVLCKASEKGLEAMREAWKALPLDVRHSITASDIEKLKRYAASVEIFVNERM